MEETLKEKKFTLQTKAGCKRWLALFICCILLFSFIACIISTNGFTVKVEDITIDVRGATLNGKLYYPAKTSDHDSLPAVIVAHGGGCAYGVVNGLADELARRGFVVFNVSAYGCGLSEQPMYDEGGQGVDGYSFMRTPQGYIDALDYVRSLKFVDPTRIGITGHSMGGTRAGTTAVMDCGFLNLNDQLINLLYDEFGQTFTEEEISEDANELAEARLNPDELALYRYRANEITERFNTRLKSVCFMGNNGQTAVSRKTVTVAGYEVMRNCQVNIGLAIGAYDDSYYNFASREWARDAWFTGDENIQLDTWYVLDDYTQSSSVIGAYLDPSVTEGQAIQDAIDSRMLRMHTLNLESHSKNFFSSHENADVCAYFNESLRYNRGNYDDGTANPLAPTNQIWFGRALCNGLAMLSMIGMLISLAALLTKEGFFASVVAEPRTSGVPFNKKRYWVFGVLTIIATFIAIYCTTKGFMPNTLFNGLITLQRSRFFSLFPSGFSATKLLAYLATMSILFLIAYALVGKKIAGVTGLKALNVGIKFKNIMKALLLGLVLLVAGYMSLCVIDYLFGQDYRFWQTMYPLMKLEYWGIFPRYAFIFYLPCYLIIGMAINYTVRDDIPAWKDTILTVIINSAGVWLCCFVNYLVLRSNTPGVEAHYFATFITYYYTLVTVPIAVYISRKMYKITNSVWAGAFLNAFLTGWSIVAATGIDMTYSGTTFAELFFGF